MANNNFNCPHCGKQIYAIPKPGQLAIKPARSNRLSHLFESETRSPFGGQHSLRSEAATLPGNYDKTTPVSKIETGDITAAAYDAGISLAIAGVGATGVMYLVGYGEWYVAGPMVGFAVGAGRYFGMVSFAKGLTRIVENWASDEVEIVEDVPEQHRIEVGIDEITDDGRHFIEDEISNPSISIEDLQKVSKSMYPHPNVANQWCISRAGIEKEGISQDKARAIISELKDLNYCFNGKGNKTILSLRGRSVLRKLAQNGSK